MSDGDVHLPSTSITRENIDVLSEISTKILDTTITKTYCKRTTSDERILCICKNTRCRLLSLLIVGGSQKHICISNSRGNFVLVLYISSQLALWHYERRMNFPPDGLRRPKRKLDVHG